MRLANRHANRDFGIACAAAILLTAAFAVWIGLRIDGVQVTEAVDDIGEGVAALIAAVAAINNSPSPRERYSGNTQT